MVTRNRMAAMAAGFLFFAAPAAFAQPAPGDPLPDLSDDRGSLSDVPAPATAAPAQADANAPRPLDPPAIHHAPISSAKAGEDLTIEVTIDRPQLLKSAGVVYQTGGKWFYVKLLRAEDGYAATIPAEHVKPPGLGYAIEMETLEGQRSAVFASRAGLQSVVVLEDPADVREQWLLERHDQRRSFVSATGEFVRFGYEIGKRIPCGPGLGEACPQGATTKPEVDDQYWRVEGTYTYRPMRIVSEFGFHLGVVRGTRPLNEHPPDTFLPKNYEVGLNYAGAFVRFRLASIFHVDLDALGSVTEIGFSAGAGAAVVLGDPLGTRFTLGWQTIGVTPDTYFGTRFYTKLDLPVNRWFSLGPSVEVTDMPHAERFGVRLLVDTNIAVGHGFMVGLRGGYQARVSRSGGPTIGATVGFGF